MTPLKIEESAQAWFNENFLHLWLYTIATGFPPSCHLTLQ